MRLRYATDLGFFAHAVGETNRDLMALIGAASAFAGPGILVPLRNGAPISVVPGPRSTHDTGHDLDDDRTLQRTDGCLSAIGTILTSQRVTTG